MSNILRIRFRTLTCSVTTVVYETQGQAPEVIVIKKTSIIVLLLAGLILPVWAGHTTAEAGSGATLAPVDICDAKPCKELIEDRIKCFMPPPPPASCRDCPTPGFALAIIKDDKVIFEGASGFANLEKHERITSNTVFDLASITKQFTAAAIMMLIEDPTIKVKRGHRLTVDTSLSDIPIDFPPEHAKDIILADLLTHQAGLPDYIAEYQKHHRFDFKKNLKEGKPTWYETMDHRKKKEELTNEGAFKLIKEAEPKRGRDPGIDFNYSNSGYVVLARIIEKLTHKTYKQFLQEKIFDPLGMTNTSVFDEHSDKISNHAFPYRQREGRYFVMEGYTPINFVYGDGNIHSTLGDMIKWVQAIDKLEHGLPGKLPLKCETFETAFQSTRLREDLSKPLRYGFGFFVARKNREMEDPTTRVIYHAGDWYGFHSYMLDGRIEKSGKTICEPGKTLCELTMIVLSNFEPELHDQSQNRPCHLARELSKFIWGDNKNQNIILDDNKMFCGSEPKPTCGPPLRCATTPGN